MQKIWIRNETRYDTRLLRSAVLATAKAWEWDIRRMGRITFTYSRGGGASGLARIGGGFVRIRLPREKCYRDRLGQVLAHELAHTHGLRHHDMTGTLKGTRIWQRPVNWLDKLPPVLEEKPVVKKPRVVGLALAEKKLAHVEAKAAEVARRIKALRTREKTWKRKVSYYTRRCAALKPEKV